MHARVRWLVSLVFPVAWGAGLAVGAEPVLLVNDGRPAAAIVLPGDAAADESLAAEELQGHLEKMSGARLEILRTVPADGRVPIKIGLSLAPEAAAEIEKQSHDPAALRVAVTSAGVSLAGLSPEGTLFAVYELLEGLGCRWYLPGELGTVIPRRSRVALPIGTRCRAPSFASRHLQGISQTLPWYRRQRLGGPRFPSAHGIHLRPALGKGETSLLALVSEERRGPQLCISNPQVFERAVAYALDYFEKHPEQPWIGMGPADGGGFCECEACRKLDSGQWDVYAARPSVTDRYVWFFNRLLEAVQRKYPGKKLCFYVYSAHQLPPRKVQPSASIVPALAPINSCRIHGMSNPICPDRSFYRTLMTDWGKLVPEVYERGYYFNLACPQFPFSKIHTVRDETVFAHRAGVKGWRVECVPSWACTGPTLYVAARLMWDVHADVDALLAEFYRGFFGPAGPPMGAYLELVDHAFRDTDCHTGGSFCMPRVFTAQRRRQAQTLLAQATTLAAADPMFVERVQMFRQNHERLEAFLAMLEGRNQCDFAASRAALERLQQLTRTLGGVTLDTETGGKPRARGEARALVLKSAEGYLRRFWMAPVLAGHERTIERGELVAACADEWDFLIDPTDVGETAGWQAGEPIGGNWQRLRTTTASWSDQGLHYYKGYAWYRTRVTVPQQFAGRKVYLWFGGVDEAAKVWLNGRLLGTSAAPGEGLPGAAGTFQPFEFEATAAVRCGAANTLAVKIINLHVNELGTGGIVAPVMFWSPRVPTVPATVD